MTVHDPLHRVSYRFRREEGRLWVETWLDDGGHLPEHFHPSLDETWQALDGTVRFKVDGVWCDIVPDDGPVHVGRNVRHALKNESGRQAYLRAEVTPAGRLDAFLTESAVAAHKGLYNAHNLPTSLRGAIWVADMAQRYRDETVMCWPPPALQRAILPLVARFAR